jgi:hypothetical protein
LLCEEVWPSSGRGCVLYVYLATTLSCAAVSVALFKGQAFSSAFLFFSFSGVLHGAYYMPSSTGVEVLTLITMPW